MTTFETWSLIIGAFSAIGTVGAVTIALWATLHRRTRYVVKDIRVSAQMEFPKAQDETPPGLTESFVHFLFENRQEFQLEVMSITLMLSRIVKPGQSGLKGIGIGDSLRGNFIPAQSQYEVRLNVLGARVPFPENEVGNITCEIKTSAGDTVVPFPNEWRSLLFKSLNFSADEIVTT